MLQWRGIRGGTREAAFLNSETFALEVSFYIDYDGSVREASYRIEVNPNTGSRPPKVCAEHLLVEGLESPIFESKQFLENPEYSLSVKTYGESFLPHSLTSDQPIIAQLVSRKFPQIFPKKKFFLIQEIAQKSLDALNDMRFLDLDPDVMRLPSFPGQIILGDRGENLSSVLQTICKDPTGKHTLLQWIQELTPMDAKDFEFPVDLTGKILLTLVEESGQKTSAYSASHGTLRFLATIAALLGPEPASFYFIICY
ncbi:hypothetical protein F7734_43405 [Scytonema sp. UIC 10036]|uniref:AAA family ATPase n=1 Tax=Scytonema sp. UIC 10036 TaxID=2304196 RepID=UPI0012DAF68A|nr:hypothetical protein [Scytonema sp. UIC 10036]MUG98778.1 hypothetical protein [Scytonema sp. UIC 10036]